MDGIVMHISEIDNHKASFRLYLNGEEAHKLAEFIIEHSKEYC